jgi:hypothetical protein
MTSYTPPFDIQSGPDVEVECHVLRVVRVGSASVKVDDISYLRSTSVNDPVVSIERWSVASHEHQLRPSLLRSNGRTDPNNPKNMAFYLDVRPALDSYEGWETRAKGLWRQWTS